MTIACTTEEFGIEVDRTEARVRKVGSCLRRIAFAMTGFLFCPLVRAHDPGLSTGRLTMTPSGLEAILTFATTDGVALLTANQRTPVPLDAVHLAAVQRNLEAVGRTLLSVRSGETTVELTDVKVALPPGNNVVFALQFARPPAGELRIEALRLADLPVGHRELFSIVGASGDAVGRKLLRRDDNTFVVGATARGLVGSANLLETPSFWGFLKLGLLHIPTGYDHLVFLFGLFIACDGWRSLLGIVSSFTIGHSLTLALATLGLVHLPSRVVDPCIAASIMYVGIDNLSGKPANFRSLWALTFAFGLIHGFGFATVLRELGIGEDDGRGVAVPLFTFNLGVELGQILIAALVLPLVWHWRQQEAFRERGVKILSASIAFLGLYWLLERTLYFFSSPAV